MHPVPPPPPAVNKLKIKAWHSKVTIYGKKAVALVTPGHPPTQFLITRQLNGESGVSSLDVWTWVWMEQMAVWHINFARQFSQVKLSEKC